MVDFGGVVREKGAHGGASWNMPMISSIIEASSYGMCAYSLPRYVLLRANRAQMNKLIKKYRMMLDDLE